MTLIVALLAILAPSPVNIGRGTIFGPAAHDRSNPSDWLACAPLVDGRWRRVDPSELAVALPPWMAPCGAWVVVCLPRTGRCAVARKMDVGPHRAMVGIDRGAIDMTDRVSRALGGITGDERVRWWVIGKGVKR